MGPSSGGAPSSRSPRSAAPPARSATRGTSSAGGKRGWSGLASLRRALFARWSSTRAARSVCGPRGSSRGGVNPARPHRPGTTSRSLPSTRPAPSARTATSCAGGFMAAFITRHRARRAPSRRALPGSGPGPSRGSPRGPRTPAPSRGTGRSGAGDSASSGTTRPRTVRPGSLLRRGSGPRWPPARITAARSPPREKSPAGVTRRSPCIPLPARGFVPSPLAATWPAPSTLARRSSAGGDLCGGMRPPTPRLRGPSRGSPSGGPMCAVCGLMASCPAGELTSRDRSRGARRGPAHDLARDLALDPARDLARDLARPRSRGSS